MISVLVNFRLKNKRRPTAAREFTDDDGDTVDYRHMMLFVLVTPPSAACALQDIH